VIVVGGGRMGQIRAAAFFGSRKSYLAGERPGCAIDLNHMHHHPTNQPIADWLDAFVNFV
jgi:hypothetical protein